jgi:hypothetical protein
MKKNRLEKLKKVKRDMKKIKRVVDSLKIKLDLSKEKENFIKDYIKKLEEDKKLMNSFGKL